MKAEEVAQAQAARIREAWVIFNGGWVHFAKMIRDFQDASHYKTLGFHGIDEWLEDEHYPRSTIKRWVGLVRKHDALPPETLSRISRANAGLLLKCPETKRYDNELVKAAETQNYDQFRGTIQRKFGNLHLEDKALRSWRVEESLAVVIDEAMELAKSCNETESDIVALEVIFREYTENHENDC